MAEQEGCKTCKLIPEIVRINAALRDIQAKDPHNLLLAGMLARIADDVQKVRKLLLELYVKGEIEL